MLTDFSRFTRVYLPGKTHTEFFFPAESTNPEKVDIFYTYIYERVTKNVSHLYFLSFPFLSFFLWQTPSRYSIHEERRENRNEQLFALGCGATRWRVSSQRVHLRKKQLSRDCLEKSYAWKKKRNLFFDGKIQKDSIASKFEAVVEDYKLSLDSVLAFSF